MTPHVSPTTPSAVQRTVADEHGSVASSSLLAHSKEAMLAAIEIYNKPTITYRNECAVILVMNSWELVLKALLVSNGHSIHETNGQQMPTRTISWRRAWHKSQQFLPSHLANPATRTNLVTLAEYRDQAIHYYNSQATGIFLHLLLQAAIVNYRDLVKHIWSIDIADDMTWHVLPVGMKPPTDILSYLGHATKSSDKSVASTFLTKLYNSLNDLITSGEDIDRLLIKVTVGLESLKKADHANVVAGVNSVSGGDDSNLIIRQQDPNQSHPFRQTEVLAKVKQAGGRKLTQPVFQAIVRKYEMKSHIKYCWMASGKEVIKYSPEAVKLIGRLSASEVDEAVEEYRHYLQHKTP